MDTIRTLTIAGCAIWCSLSVCAKDIIVKPGTYSIEKALQEARVARVNESIDDITLHLQPGDYRINQSIIVRPEDSGTKIVADGKVTIHGGVKIEGWRKHGKFYVADVPLFNGRPLEFRQLWINGKKATRARDVEDFEQMARIISVDKENEILYVPSTAVGMLKSKNATVNAEMILHEMWCIANLRIKNIDIQGDKAAVTFHQPESHIQFMHPWPSPMVTTDGHNSAFYLTNNKVFLDKPGEWYLDTKAEKVYYIPQKGEDMRTADVEVPAVETLLRIEGTPDQPVHDVSFEGITFSYATWMRPSILGHVPLQAGMYMTEAYKLRPKWNRPNGDHKLDNQGWVGRPASAVLLNSTENVSFKQCTFEHNASCAIDYHRFTKGGSIENCTIRDIGGNGIQAGIYGPEYFESHVSYSPSDEREICTDLLITNNLITDVTNEDWGCIGIAAGYVRGIQILHNEISEVSYTGISLGWGWNQQVNLMKNNLVKGNLIHHYASHMYDTAGIYTLSCQPHTFIEENVVRDIYHPGYVHSPNHWFYLYTDEGSSYITVRNNWTPSEKFLKNANGPGNTWENNGPMVADSIKDKAGRISPL